MSTRSSERISFNAELLKKDIKRKYKSGQLASEAIGKNPDYLNKAIRDRVIGAEALQEIAGKLKKDPERYADSNEANRAPALVSEEHEAQQQPKRRREYTAQERDDFLRMMKTAGRKGVKLPRINMAFAPDVYEYIQIMSRASGLSLTNFVNLAMREHARNHEELYSQAREIRSSL